MMRAAPVVIALALNFVAGPAWGQARLYLFWCGGDVAEVELASGKSRPMPNPTELGWAPEARDGCSIESLSYQMATRTLVMVAPQVADVDDQGMRKYKLLQWNVDTWTLVRSLDFQDMLSSVPNVLVPRTGTDLLVSYEQSGSAGIAVVGSSPPRGKTTLAAANLGPWFSAQAVVGPSESIIDGTTLLQHTGSGWHRRQVQGAPGFFPLKRGAGGRIFFAAASGETTTLMTVDPERDVTVQTRIEGAFAAGELTPIPDGGAIVSVAAKVGPAKLWDLASGKLLATAPLPTAQSRSVVCMGPDGTTVVRADDELYLLSWPQAGKITPSSRADSGTGCVFSP